MCNEFRLMYVRDFSALVRMPSLGVPVASSLDFSKLSVSDGNTVGTSQRSGSSELPLDGWDGIALEYSIDWPLQLFFTPEVLSK